MAKRLLCVMGLAGVLGLGLVPSMVASAEAAQRARVVGAQADQQPKHVASRQSVVRNRSTKGKRYSARRRGGLECVPFARNASGILIKGNAHLWWESAEGVYARGQAPEDGAVLSFRSNRSMPLGHVAVVKKIINSREIEIDHANWAGPRGRKGLVTRGVSVVDVSEYNDWTAVRVELGQTGNYGSIYPTNGFIYERPDEGEIVVAAAAAPVDKASGAVPLLPVSTPPLPGLNPPSRDLRPAELRTASNAKNSGDGYASVTFVGGRYEEVAEAPAPVKRHVRRASRARTAAR